MLRPEVERHETHPILALKHLTAAQIVDGLRVQLDAFWRNEWPFDQQVENNDALSWWESLRCHTHARVLAVCTVSCLFFRISLNTVTANLASRHQTLLNSGQLNA